jgi:molybdenum cofactor sulfurtransferase
MADTNALTHLTPEEAFLARYPDYARTFPLDALRAEEYERLDRLGQVYLDYTGGGLYANRQIAQHMQWLRNGVYGNPHSCSPSSLAAAEHADAARAHVLKYFHADPAEYDVIFTANASGALKLVGESYPFGPDAVYGLTFDNHNSVNGIREYARGKGARIAYVPVTPPDLRIDRVRLLELLDEAPTGGARLLGFPAQSNFSGVQHDLAWVERARGRGWDVLLDAAAFAPTNRLNLRQVRPDFVTVAFYKMFGYPTGLGALIARREALARLRRPWFAGGTITIATVQGETHFLADDHAAFEDGTINYLGLPAVQIGLQHLEAAGLNRIHARVMALAGYLLEALTALRHTNGAPMAEVYGPTTTEARGGTISLNFLDPDGAPIDYRWVERQAAGVGISLRTGCFCNPGAGEVAHGLTESEIRACLQGQTRVTFEQFVGMLGRMVGAVRISLGIASNFADAHRFVTFAESLRDVRAATTHTPTPTEENPA